MSTMGRSKVLLAVVVAVAAGLVAGGGCRRAEPRRTWTWQEGGLDELLAAARAQQATALLEVYAAWCPSCHQLERDVFVDNAAQLPLDRLVGGRVDFDTPEGQAIAERYRVIGLPTTLLLDPDGAERGRVEGFETVDAYVAGVRKALAGEDEVAAAVARLAEAPDDPEVLVAAGAARLVRGEEEEGVRLLERARALDRTEEPQACYAATRTLGRYYYRVRHDYGRALDYFAEGAAMAGRADAAWGFHYWSAMCLRQLGRPDEAVRLLDGLVAAHPGRVEPLTLKADYLYMTGEDDAEALAAAREAARIEPTDAECHHLVAVLAERGGDRDGALAAARRAVELEPGKAIYEHLLERLRRPAP